MTLNQLVNQINQIVADNPQVGNLPVYETYYVSRGHHRYNAYREIRRVLVGEAEVFVKQRSGVYHPEMKPAVIFKLNDD